MSQPVPLPVSHEEMLQRGWDEVDIVFVTGDAYVDHPSFATALLARVLEAEGLRVGILAQPDWHSAEPWKIFGKPTLGFCVSAGNMDSMINHYTANRKVRNEDAYSPNGQIGLRPDRATLAYCQRAREAYPGCVVIAGGVEASLRRISHYDYWSDKVKRSIVLDSKADLVVYGMGETPLLEIVRRLKNGESAEQIRDVRGTAYRLKKSEDLPEESETLIHLPSHEEVEEDKSKFSKMTRIVYENLNPYNAATLVQEHSEEAVVVNPPAFPVSTEELDRIYGLPFTRQPHPSYGNVEIPAFKVIQNSVQIHRGCYGGCSFCSLAAHQGKFIQSRSKESICGELSQLAGTPDSPGTPAFKGIISDLGGPTANMYKTGCENEEARKECRRTSCLVPEPCVNLNADHGELLDLMKAVREIPGIEKVFIASGVRTDLALLDERYVKELVEHHIGGHLKTAPEHTDPEVLKLMNKPTLENYEEFCRLFERISDAAGKEQYLVPYLIAGFPGTTLEMMVETAVTLKRFGIRSEQVQEFIPGPFELATCMYYTGMNPLNGHPVYVPRRLRERRLQKALLMYDDLENYHDIKSALIETGREDLIGNDPDCLIPPYPPKSLALKQTSRVKRLQKQNEKDKQEKTRRREEFEQENRQKKSPSRPSSRRTEFDGAAERRPFRDRPPRDDNRGERRGPGSQSSARWNDRPPRDDNRGERRPFRDRPPRDDNRGERRPFRDRPPRDDNRGERRPFRDRPPRDDNRGEQRPFRDRPPRDDNRGERRGPGSQTPARWNDRPPRKPWKRNDDETRD